LQTPLSHRDIIGLNLCDLVFFDGIVYTCRGLFHRRVIDERTTPPLNLKNLNVMFHTGPVVVEEKGKWRLISMQPTTSNRFEKWGARIVKQLHIRAIIGKGTMGKKTAEAMAKYGCVHLSAIGIAGTLLAMKARVEAVYWLDELGPIEALWILSVKNFGPFFVDIDARGNRYFKEIREKVEQQRYAIYDEMGIPKDFNYSTL
jgi:fumarate hydratase subunit beta